MRILIVLTFLLMPVLAHAQTTGPRGPDYWRERWQQGAQRFDQLLQQQEQMRQNQLLLQQQEQIRRLEQQQQDFERLNRSQRQYNGCVLNCD